MLLLAALGAACGHGAEKEWSKEELAELEERWGHEVSIVCDEVTRSR